MHNSANILYNRRFIWPNSNGLHKISLNESTTAFQRSDLGFGSVLPSLGVDRLLMHDQLDLRLEIRLFIQLFSIFYCLADIMHKNKVLVY